MHQLFIVCRFAPKSPVNADMLQYPRVRKHLPHGVANTGAGGSQRIAER